MYAIRSYYEKERIAIKKIEQEKIRKEKIRKEKIRKEREEKLYIDKKQNLIWQDDNMVLINKKPWITEENYNNKKYFDTKGDTAATYCKKLTLGNYKDWRLPTKDELKNLSLQKKYLKNVGSNWYWSDTTSSINNELAWSIYFDNSDGYADRITSYNVCYTKLLRFPYQSQAVYSYVFLSLRLFHHLLEVHHL